MTQQKFCFSSTSLPMLFLTFWRCWNFLRRVEPHFHAVWRERRKNKVKYFNKKIHKKSIFIILTSGISCVYKTFELSSSFSLHHSNFLTSSKFPRRVLVLFLVSLWKSYESSSNESNHHRHCLTWNNFCRKSLNRAEISKAICYDRN